MISNLLTFGTKNQKTFYSFLKHHFLINVNKLFFFPQCELNFSTVLYVEGVTTQQGDIGVRSLEQWGPCSSLAPRVRFYAAVTLWRLRSLFCYCLDVQHELMRRKTLRTWRGFWFLPSILLDLPTWILLEVHKINFTWSFSILETQVFFFLGIYIIHGLSILFFMNNCAEVIVLGSPEHLRRHQAVRITRCSRKLIWSHLMKVVLRELHEGSWTGKLLNPLTLSLCLSKELVNLPSICSADLSCPKITIFST